MGAKLTSSPISEITPGLVAELVAHCKAPQGGRAPDDILTDRFRELIFEAASEIIRERREQNILAPLTVADLRMIIHAEVIAAAFPGSVMRLDGVSLTHESHLHGTLINIIRDAGRTRLSIAMACPLHDLPELGLKYLGTVDVKRPSARMRKVVAEAVEGARKKKEPAVKERKYIFETFEEFFELWKDSFRDPSDPLCDPKTVIAQIEREVENVEGEADRDPQVVTEKRIEEITVKKTLRRVWSLITAVKKESYKEDRALELAATCRKYLAAVAGRGLSVLIIKLLGDRLNNMRKIVSQKKERKDPIAEETYELHCRFAAYFGFRDHPAIAEMTEICAEILNQKGLLNDFTALRDGRLRKNLDETRVDPQDMESFTVREQLMSILPQEEPGERRTKYLNGIKEVKIVPARLADFTLQRNEELRQLTIQDLPITSFDPLFETVVILEPGTDADLVIKYIRRHFGVDDDFGSVKKIEGKVPRGVRFTIQSEGFGILNFRVNDAVSEARSKRGILQPRQGESMTALDDPLPEDLNDAINGIIEATRGGTREDILRVIPLARERLFRPTITVFTPPPKHEPKTLPLGATGLDFANAVHTDFLGRPMRIICHRSKTDFGPVHPSDALEDGLTYEVVLADETQAGFLKPGPGEVYFCKTESARKNLRRKLIRGMTSEDVRTVGATYVNQLAHLFGLEPKVLLDHVRKSMGPTTPTKVQDEAKGDGHEEAEGYEDSRIYKALGSGKVDVLSILSQACFKDKTSWAISARMQNRYGTLHDFSGEFAAEKMNIDKFKFPNDRAGTNIAFMQVSDASGQKKPFDMMRSLLRLSRRYEGLTVSSDDEFRKVFEQLTFGQFLSDIFDTVRRKIGTLLLSLSSK
ncbi:MAG: hypothetical protein AAB588_04940 [Patescibacteria group bacterium]